MNVSMPDELREFVDSRTKLGGFSTPTEYVRHLIREDRKRETERRLEALLLEGLDSGEPVEATAEWWEAKRRELARRVAERTARP